MNKPLALVVEDDYKQADIFAEALKAAEYEAEIIENGSKALKRLAEITPTIVLLDLHLPQLSGKELLDHIRTDERLAKIRVMITTADPILAQNLSGQADLVLLKPIAFSQLRDLAARLRPPDIMGEID